MPQNAASVEDIRSAAELLIQNSRQMAAYRGSMTNSLQGQQLPFDINRTHSINLITEEFLGGYMQDGRMSVVRRFFCLFVAFDLIFVSLLWLICIVINGDNIFIALQKQIVHYTVYTSLFDVVAAAVCRFVFLIFFYALLYVNHWFVIAFSTSGSCLFLISKVFVFNWIGNNQQVFVVVLILTSFVLAFGEAWFFDCRVIPQESHARRYFSSAVSSDRSPLMIPFLASQAPPPESIADFYSPLDTAHNSDPEDDEDEEYHQMGIDCTRRVLELLQTSEWKVEKVTSKGDTIQSTQREKIGKIFRLTARIKYPAKALMEELFYNIENVPKWNPTLLESKIIRKINSYTDITYQASIGGGGGIVKSRDFINLRCWRLFRNGQMCCGGLGDFESSDDDDNNTDLNRSYEGSVTTASDGGDSITPQPSSVESTYSRTKLSAHSSQDTQTITHASVYNTLSKSLGAKSFSEPINRVNQTNANAILIDFEEPPPLDEEFEDAKDNLDDEQNDDDRDQSVVMPDMKNFITKTKDKVWVNAAVSIQYAKVPPTTKYTRGENIVAGFVMREIAGKSDTCIFEWILCLDLKGFIPRYVLDTAYTQFMTDYMTYLRKYVNELKQCRQRVPKNI